MANIKANKTNHNLRHDIHTLCASQLAGLAMRMYASVIAELYEQITSTVDWLQEDYSVAINFLDANKEWLSTRLCDRVLHKLDGLSDNTSEAPGKLNLDDLGLVAKDEFEEWLSVNKAIKIVQRELAEPLQRIDTLFKQVFVAFKKQEELPVGPEELLKEIKHGVDELEIPGSTHGFLYKAFARAMVAELAEFYRSLDSLAKKHRLVLDSGMPTKEGRAEKHTTRAADTPAYTNNRASEHGAETGASPSGVSQSPESSAPGIDTLSALTRLNATVASGSRFGSARPVAPSHVAHAPDAASATLDLDGQKLISLISELEAKTHLQDEHVSVGPLRALIEQGIAASSLPESSIAQTEAEKIDVTDRFFEVIVDKVGVSGALKNWVEKLKFTILKVVLRDEDFFSNAAHPARELLNKLAKLSSGEGGGHRRLQEALNKHIDRVVNEYDQNPSAVKEVVEQLDVMIDRQDRAYQRNSERIARSYEDKQRIAVARHKVVQDLRELLSGKSVPLVLLELLDKAGWREHLAATVVRQGERSEAYEEAFNVLEQLLYWFGTEQDDSDRWAIELEMELEAPTLYEQVSRELTPYSKADLPNVLGHLEDCLFNEAEPINVQIEEYDWPFERHEKDIEELKPDGNQKSDQSYWHKRVASMKIGDWVEMNDAQGRKRCLRLAWSGRESFRFVFVDNQGMKDEDISFAELIERFKNDEASFIESGQVPLVDQGLHQMVHSVYEELSTQASCDVVTGLLNRQAFERAMNQCLAKALSTRKDIALLYLDIDRFGVTNTSYGNLAGDALLKHVASLLKSNCPAGAYCGRLGGNEFGIILPQADVSTSSEVAEHIRTQVAENSFVWESNDIDVTVSIGVANVDLEIDDYDSVMRKVNRACVSAKSSGQNRVVRYQEQDDDQRKKDDMLYWVQRMDGSLDDLLALRCQEIRPIRREQSNFSHWEILLGVKHEGKLLPPSAFIEAAEHFGRMAKVDRWVIHHTLEWMEEHPEFVRNSDGFSINLSGNSLSDDNFLEFVLGELASSDVPAEKICFEITETAAIGSIADASEFIRALKQEGCTFSLDDFGSGLSSYAYIQKLPVDYIKIDGIFIRDLVKNKNDQALVRSINELAHFMGMQTVAEYVENSEILELLREIGVDHSQGYGIKKPIPLQELSA